MTESGEKYEERGGKMRDREKKNLTELLRFISLNSVPKTTQSPSSLSLPSLSMIRARIGTSRPHFCAAKAL